MFRKSGMCGEVYFLSAAGIEYKDGKDVICVCAIAGILDLMFTANPDIKSVGLLYSQSEDASKQQPHSHI